MIAKIETPEVDFYFHRHLDLAITVEVGITEEDISKREFGCC
jgi:hypothetical protein